MNRALQLAALLVFLAVLILLLTPADDGPVMEVRGQQMSAALLFALVALATRHCLAPQRRRPLELFCCSAAIGYGPSPSLAAPLLC